MEETDDDLANRLNSFLLSSSEDSLAKGLESAHIGPKPAAAMFGGSAGNSSGGGGGSGVGGMMHNTATTTITTQEQQRQQQDELPWDPMPAENTSGGDDEGWGDLPSTNTAAAGDSLFGFSSILQTDYFPSASNSVNPNSAFGKFRHAPVSFTSTHSNPRS